MTLTKKKEKFVHPRLVKMEWKDFDSISNGGVMYTKRKLVPVGKLPPHELNRAGRRAFDQRMKRIMRKQAKRQAPLELQKKDA